MSDIQQLNPLLFNRTISQILEIFVIPEIEKRIANGKIEKSDLPLEIRQFRAIQKKLGDHNYTPIVEINAEVNIILKVKNKKPFTPGMPVTLADIDPAECYLQPPQYDGKPAGYFYWFSNFLDSILIFDLEYNAQDDFAKDLQGKMQFPILDILNAQDFLKVVRPLEKFRALSDNNWPPAPGYIPTIMRLLHDDPKLLGNDSFIDVVSGIYNSDYWKNKLDFWVQTNFFPKRVPYIERAIKAHYTDDFITSTYVLVPQFEGIITDYLHRNLESIPDEFIKKIKALNDICLSRKILLYPKEVLEVILDYLENGSFWARSESIDNPKVSINRHGILHGVFTDFECKEISLKYLILFDALAYILLNDKIVSGKL
jgi:hypothetical protein